MGLGFLDLSAVKSPTCRTHPGQEEGREALPTDPVDCGLGAQCPAQDLAHSRAGPLDPGLRDGWKEGWGGGRASAQTRVHTGLLLEEEQLQQ